MSEQVRGSNRAVSEYAEELRRAEHDLEMARQRVDTLRRKAAGPTYPAPCCRRWSWRVDIYSARWEWCLLRTCALEWSPMLGWHGCPHDHHKGEPAPAPMS